MLLHLHPFAPHKDTRLELPDTGLVTVQGVNESGKSTLLEAYCAALWGRSLRGASAWRTPDCHVAVGLPGAVSNLLVEREQHMLRVNGQEALKPTKKQAELCSLVGTWENFQRIRCFDADLTARFGAATDSDRKRLLEQLCGLDTLDEGLKRCRADLREAERKHTAAEQRYAIADATVPQAVEPPDPAALAHATQVLDAVEQRVRALSHIEGERTAQVQAAERKLATMQSGHCPTCAQPVPATLLQQFRDMSHRARAERAQVEAERRASNAEGSVLLGRLRELQAQQAAAQRAAQEAERRAAALSEREKLAAERRSAEQDVAGLRGVQDFIVWVRPRLLESSLASLEVAAASWLSVLDPRELSLKLHGDDVRLSLGDRNYKELNRGHRRRLDLSLMLGLSQLHTAPVKGPVFLDEILDGVDSAGCDALASVLEAVAQRELVILLTHSADIAGRLGGLHLRCARGTVTVDRG